MNNFNPANINLPKGLHGDIAAGILTNMKDFSELRRETARATLNQSITIAEGEDILREGMRILNNKALTNANTVRVNE
jgi:hypothetical protein